MAQLPKVNEDSNFDLKYTNLYDFTTAYNAKDFLDFSSTVHKSVHAIYGHNIFCIEQYTYYYYISHHLTTELRI